MHGEFYYDGEKVQVYDRGKEEKEWLGRARKMVQDYINVVEDWGRKQENPLWRTVEEEVEEYASLGEKGTWKLGGQLREE